MLRPYNNSRGMSLLLLIMLSSYSVEIALISASESINILYSVLLIFTLINEQLLLHVAQFVCQSLRRD